MSARFARNNTAEQRQGMAHQGNRRQHVGFRVFHISHPQLFMVLPLRKRQLQRGFQTLFNAGFRRNVQDGRLFQHARRISGGQMVTPRGFTHASLTQSGLVHQPARQLQHVICVPFQQLKLEFTNRFLALTRLHVPQIESDFDAAFAFRHQPFLAPEIGAEQRLHLFRQRGRQLAIRPDFRRETFQLKFRLADVDIVFRALM